MSFGTTPTSSATFHLVFLVCRPGAAGLVLKTISKAMASLDNNSQLLKTARPLGPLDRDMSDKTSCCSCWSRVETEILEIVDSQVLALRQQLQVKHSPFASPASY